MAGLPEYRNSKNSSSVNTFAFRHILAKKKVVNIPPISMFHHNQFPEIPFFLTTSATHNGVSAAKVVATIEIPAMYHGKFLPAKKKSVNEPLALFLNFNPINNVIPKKTATIIQSTNSKTIVKYYGRKIVKFQVWVVTSKNRYQQLMSYNIDIQQIQRYSKLELIAKQIVEGFVTGLHKSPYHGFFG